MNKFKKLINIFIFQFFILFIFGSLSAKDLNLNYSKDRKFNTRIEKTFYDKNNDLFYIFFRKKLFFYKKNELKGIIETKNIINKKLINFLVFNNFIVFILKDSSIIAIDKVYGNVLWKKRFDQKIFFKPVIDQESIFFDQGAGNIISLDIKTGEIIWSFKNRMRKLFIYTNGKVLQTKDNIIYVYSNKVLVINKETGKKVTSSNVQTALFFKKKSRARKISDLEIYNNILFICYNDGSFVVFDLKHTEVLWKKSKDNYNFISIYKNFLLISKNNNKLTLLNKFNGKKIFTTDLKDINITAKPIFINKSVIVFGDTNGFIYFFEINKRVIVKKMKIFKDKVEKIFINKDKSIAVFSSKKLTRLIK